MYTCGFRWNAELIAKSYYTFVSLVLIMYFAIIVIMI